MKIGAGTGGLGERRVAAVGVDDDEPGAEVPERVVAAHEPADDVEPGLGVERVDEAPERLLPLGFAEVVEPGRWRRPADQLVGIEARPGLGPAHARQPWR